MGNAHSHSPRVVHEDTGTIAPATGFLNRFLHQSQEIADKKEERRISETKHPHNELDILKWLLFEYRSTSRSKEVSENHNWPFTKELKTPGYEKTMICAIGLATFSIIGRRIMIRPIIKPRSFATKTQSILATYVTKRKRISRAW